eukprot:Gb_24303 [translate_table: standard]
MDEDKKKKKKQKKKNKSNRVADERVEKAGGACSEEFQGSQGTDGISNNATRTLEAASKDKDEGEPRDLEKNEYDLQLCAPDTQEKFEKISELKDALEREVAYSQSLRIRLGFLEEQMTKRTIVEASTEEEIKRLKDEKKSQMQKEIPCGSYDSTSNQRRWDDELYVAPSCICFDVGGTTAIQVMKGLP